MNRITRVLVVLVACSAAPGCRDEVVEPDDEKSVGQEIEEGLHEADDDIDEGTDEADDKGD